MHQGPDNSHNVPATSRKRLLAFILLSIAWCSGASTAHAQLGLVGFTLDSGNPGSMLGSAMAAGDFNADGYDDLAVGVPELNAGVTVAAGFIRVFLGGPDGWMNATLFSATSVGATSATGARFGSTLASGDFDDDGHDDLAIGAPGRTVNGALGAGEVIVIYGSPGIFFDPSRTQIFDQVALPGAPQTGDRFGTTLAAGDLSNDGVDDLVVGIPLEDVGNPTQIDAGAVTIIYGVLDVGLSTDDSQLIHEDTPGIGLNANAGERFGFSVAIGQALHNAIPDLVVGVPGEVVIGPGAKGAVVVLPGTDDGIDPAVSTEAVWSQESGGIAGTAQIDDEFGYAVAFGNFNGDPWPDLAIGAPGEQELGTTESGAVHILYGNAVGLNAANDQFLTEGVIDADVDAFDRFGTSLTAGDFNGDGRDDLAIGAPLDNSLGFVNAGEVTVVYGTSAGLDFTGHQIFDMIFFDTLEIGDEFGHALATGRFFDPTYEGEDLAVGIPLRDVPLRGNIGPGIDAGVSLVIRTRSIFSDGFEIGDTSDWSVTLP